MRKLIALLFAAMVFASPAIAKYFPDTLVLDGTQSLQFPPDDRMTLQHGATIEFWVQPDWTADPGYDPVILSNAGPEGPSYLVSLLRGRDGIGVMSGDKSDVAAFDFTDGRMHHVAIIDDGSSILVLVDNKAIGRFNMTFHPLPSAGFWIGSADGEHALFKGAIAGLRIWDVAVAPHDIEAYAMTDIMNDKTHVHPDLPWLVGLSDFKNKDFILQDYAQ